MFLPLVRDQVSQPYKTKDKIMVLYILIFKFLDSRLEDKRFCTEWQQAFLDFNLLLIPSWIEFWFVKFIPKYMNSSTLSKELLTYFYCDFVQHPDLKDMTMYLVLSALTSSPFSLLATTTASAFFFIVCMLQPNILTSSAINLKLTCTI